MSGSNHHQNKLRSVAIHQFYVIVVSHQLGTYEQQMIRAHKKKICIIRESLFISLDRRVCQAK